MKKYQIVDDKIIIPKEDVIKVNRDMFISNRELSYCNGIGFIKDDLAQDIGTYLLENNLLEVKEIDSKNPNLISGKTIRLEVYVIKPEINEKI
jgi:hypothetical protein